MVAYADVSDSAVAERSFDAVVLGAGPAGEVVAGRLEAPVEVALVEAHLVGGECSYYACMPSKALLRPAELLAEVERVPGLTVSGPDPAAVLAAARGDPHLDDAAQLPWLEERGVTIVRGFGRIVGERRVRVEREILVARGAVVVATGSGAAMPPIPGLAESSPWGNREATTAKEPPESLVILGGGVVGVELAQAWASLGTRGAARRVAAVDRARGAFRLGRGRSRAAGGRRRGANGIKAVGVSRDGDDVAVELEEDRARAAPSCSSRWPAGDQDERARPRDDRSRARRAIEVGADLRSGAHDWLYAIGDVNGRPS